VLLTPNEGSSSLLVVGLKLKASIIEKSEGAKK
jgi:hypothetical protein